MWSEPDAVGHATMDINVWGLINGMRAVVPGMVERFEPIVAGRELGNAFSELIDPIDQRERLTAQSLLAAAGDDEAMQLDEDFLRALEYGMPPTGGMGMGMDRLIMKLTGKNIRETILFPLVRPGAAQ